MTEIILILYNSLNSSIWNGGGKTSVLQEKQSGRGKGEKGAYGAGKELGIGKISKSSGDAISALASGRCWGSSRPKLRDAGQPRAPGRSSPLAPLWRGKQELRIES